MAPKIQNLHFLLVPFMAQGHLIPMVDLAKLLARRGVLVTLVTTPANKIRINSTLNRAIESGLPIRVLQLRFPSVEAGLPEGCESADAIPSTDLHRNFFVAIHMMQSQLEDWLQKQTLLPSCILADKHIAWLAESSRKFGIPRIIFDGMSCFTLLCTHNIYTSKAHESVPESEPFLVPGLPDCVWFTKVQLPGLLNPGSHSSNFDDIREQIRKAEGEAYGVVVNSFDELENRYVDGCKEIRGGKLWCVGPLSLTNIDDLDKGERGNKASIDQNQCLEWLDKHNPRSVVYTCLGSICLLTCAQMLELCSGLDSSNHPFVLVIRGGKHSQEIEDWIAKDGFEERTKGRGLLIRGWAPQVLILSHLAVGAFLTHCGWNSTLEGVSAGVPMVTWPMFAEQFFNEKLVVEVLGIGVSVGAQAVVHWGEEYKCGVSVKRETIREAVKKVMDNKGERKIRARTFGDMAKKAIDEEGSSYFNLTMLIQDILDKVKVRH